jgi:hypothetical protein
MTVPEDWTPDACTLPTADRPLRVAEFDELFAFVVRAERRDRRSRIASVRKMYAFRGVSTCRPARSA